MSTKSSDKVWEYFGKNDPYYGVLTQERYSRKALTKTLKDEFLATGEKYVSSVFATIHERFDPAFRPHRALDFGCGVGRIALPLARICDSVVGVDVSESMLAVAQKNAAEEALDNVTFVRGDDSLSRVSGRFEFVHSFIVFQHIPRKRGVRIFRQLVELLEPDGVGVLHVTYAANASWLRKGVRAARQRVPFVSGVLNVLKRKPFGEPRMQMNEYDLNELLQLLHQLGCHDVHLRFTQTSVEGHPFYGVSLFFRKRTANVTEFA